MVIVDEGIDVWRNYHPIGKYKQCVPKNLSELIRERELLLEYHKTRSEVFTSRLIPKFLFITTKSLKGFRQGHVW